MKVSKLTDFGNTIKHFLPYYKVTDDSIKRQIRYHLISKTQYESEGVWKFSKWDTWGGVIDVISTTCVKRKGYKRSPFIFELRPRS